MRLQNEPLLKIRESLGDYFRTKRPDLDAEEIETILDYFDGILKDYEDAPSPEAAVELATKYYDRIERSISKRISVEPYNEYVPAILKINHFPCPTRATRNYPNVFLISRELRRSESTVATPGGERRRPNYTLYELVGPRTERRRFLKEFADHRVIFEVHVVSASEVQDIFWAYTMHETSLLDLTDDFDMSLLPPVWSAQENEYLCVVGSSTRKYEDFQKRLREEASIDATTFKPTKDKDLCTQTALALSTVLGASRSRDMKQVE